MNKDRETEPTGFFYSKRTKKSNRLQMTWGSTSRQLFKDPDRQLVRPGFETAASRSVDRFFIHLELTGRWYNSAVFHYQVNLHLSRQKWESPIFNVTTPRMPFNYHGLSSTDYHVKVHKEENKEKPFSECASLTLIPWACKTYSLAYSMWQICLAENSLKTKIWGKRVSGTILRNWKKLVLL